MATAAGDGTLRFWNIFGVPEVAAKAAPKANPEPFSHLNRLRRSLNENRTTIQ